MILILDTSRYHHTQDRHFPRCSIGIEIEWPDLDSLSQSFDSIPYHSKTAAQPMSCEWKHFLSELAFSFSFSRALDFSIHHSRSCFRLTITSQSSDSPIQKIFSFSHLSCAPLAQRFRFELFQPLHA